MNKPVLYVFSISHYCEKAKWALDRAGVDYQLKPLVPGLHIAAAKKMGLQRASLPILQNASSVIQGSAQIIDWADTKMGGNLTVGEEQSCDIEQRLDDILGVHLRRFFYSESLVERPATVKRVFMVGLGMFDKLKLSLMWPVITKKMIDAMDIGSKQGQASRAIVEAELDWLDGLLTDGKPYLKGDKFSRADLAAASLLAPLVLPEQYPMTSNMELPPGVASDRVQWSQRPVFSWVEKIYREHR